MLPPMGPSGWPEGWQKFQKSRGSLAEKNSATDAATTADISLTVRAYDHAGLGSPPPKHFGVQSGVGISPHQTRRCSFPATPFPLSRRFRPQARLPLGKPNQPDPKAGSRRARASDILLGPKRRIRFSRAGRAGPSLGAASEMFPPDPAPLILSLSALLGSRHVAAAVADRSPPPKHFGVQSGVGMPSPALLFPATPL